MSLSHGVKEGQRDRALGCLVGLAIGDAMGAPVEFESFGSFEPVRDYRDGGPFNLKAGQWTDDTSQALCLAESLIEKGDYDEKDFIVRMCNWYQHGHNSSTGKCFDIGIGTQMALNRFIISGEVKSDTQSAGNGCIMRLAPVPIAFFRDVELTERVSEQSCFTTHGHPLALECSAFLGNFLARIIRDATPSGYNHNYNFVDHDLEINVKKRLEERQRPEHNVSGFVVDTLCAALQCFTNSESFEECVLTAVNLGGDTDTVGAVAGQIAGAFYGLNSIPKRWIDGLQDSDRILALGGKLFDTGLGG